MRAYNEFSLIRGTFNRGEVIMIYTHESVKEAWRQRKHKYACELAESEYVTDERVAKALHERYSFDNWYSEKETK